MIFVYKLFPQIQLKSKNQNLTNILEAHSTFLFRKHALFGYKTNPKKSMKIIKKDDPYHESALELLLRWEFEKSYIKFLEKEKLVNITKWQELKSNMSSKELKWYFIEHFGAILSHLIDQ